jgi:hypothetical protein
MIALAILHSLKSRSGSSRSKIGDENAFPGI